MIRRNTGHLQPGYHRGQSLTVKVKTMIRNRCVAPDIVCSTPCDWQHACLADGEVCQVEAFMDNEVQLLRCRDERQCDYRRRYRSIFICTCPVNRAAAGLN
jgi:hypothetical protein